MDQGGCKVGGKKGKNSGHKLKGSQQDGSADGFMVGCERNTGVRDDFQVLEG